MDTQEKEWGSFVEHLKTKGIVKIGRNALGVITNLVREGSCSLGYNDIELMWETWQAAKAQAVPEWIEYEKQSPRIDGRYQIFINGEQLAADWESPYGFSSAEDGTAFIQELITHWSVLNNDPVVKAQEPAND